MFKFKKYLLTFVFVLSFLAVSLVSADSISTLQTQIDAISTQVKSFQIQLDDFRPVSSVTSSEVIPGVSSVSGRSDAVISCYKWTKDLRVGDTGDDVKALNQALEAEGFGKIVAGAQNNDMAIRTFNDKTASAVVAFQEKYVSEILTPSNLNRGTGFVGGATRAKLDSLYGKCGNATNSQTISSVTTALPVGAETYKPITTKPALSSGASATLSCNINFTDDNDLDGYLGPNIYPLKESDWMHDSAIINQVNILTNGKATSMEKAIAIADWVKQSRPYDYVRGGSTCSHDCTPANAKLSVVDIYNESAGVCLDSGIITIAMFRLAGIPARLTFPTLGISHARAQAYIDKQWVTFDSTFGSGPADVNITEFPPFVVSYFGEFKNPDLYFKQPMQPGEYFGTHVFKQFNLANNDSVFGTLTLANIPSNGKLYVNDSLFDIGNNNGYFVSFDITKTDSKDLYYMVNNNQVKYVFSSSEPPGICSDSASGISSCVFYTKFFRNAIMMTPSVILLDRSDNPGTSVSSVVNPLYRYLGTFKLPLGKYKITYFANLPMSIGDPTIGGRKDIAFADFEVLQGGITKLTSDKFRLNGTFVRL